MTKLSDENPANDIEPRSENETSPKVFEYLGNHSLILKGISSGTKYHFRFTGDRVEVNYFDSFALMAERDLKVTS